MNLNNILELVYGNLAILRAEFGVFLFLYIARQAALRQLDVSDWFLSLPLGMAVALSLFVNTTGEWGRNVVAWSWVTAGINTRPLTDFELWGLFACAFLAGVGLVMMIRVFSKPVFGDWPWAVCTLSALVYTSVTIGRFT